MKILILFFIILGACDQNGRMDREKNQSLEESDREMQREEERREVNFTPANH